MHEEERLEVETRRTTWQEKNWKGPFRVFLTTTLLVGATSGTVYLLIKLLTRKKSGEEVEEVLVELGDEKEFATWKQGQRLNAEAQAGPRARNRIRALIKRLRNTDEDRGDSHDRPPGDSEA